MCNAISLHVNFSTPSSGMNILMHAVTDGLNARLQDLTGGGGHAGSSRLMLVI